jgi:integrase/recombinase XerD
MKCIISDQVVFLRPPQGPLALYIASFSTWASALGYALYSLRRRVRIAVDFSRWLAEKSIRLSSVSLGTLLNTCDIARDGNGFAKVTLPR